MGVFHYFYSKKNRKALIAISSVSLIGFLDELSFWERLFNLNMPYIYDEKIDGVHDFLNLAYEIIIKLTNTYSVCLILILLNGAILVTALLIKHRLKFTRFITSNYGEPPFILAFIFSVLLFSSQVLYLGLIKNENLFIVEEIFEMNASLALIFCCLSLKEKSSTN